MSKIEVDKVDPQSGTALEIGTSGDTVTVPSGVGLTLTDSTLLLPTTITSTTEVKTNKISPATGVAFAWGDSGDTFTVASGAALKIGTAPVKVAGKETMWVPASAMYGATTNGADAQQVETTAVRPDMKVLDLGTGSGILAISAKKIGAEKVDAVENDLECQSNFLENIKLNKIIDGINFFHKDVLDWDALDYDLILVNINQKIIEKLIL